MAKYKVTFRCEKGEFITPKMVEYTDAVSQKKAESNMRYRQCLKPGAPYRYWRFVPISIEEAGPVLGKPKQLSLFE